MCEMHFHNNLENFMQNIEELKSRRVLYQPTLEIADLDMVNFGPYLEVFLT